MLEKQLKPGMRLIQVNKRFFAKEKTYIYLKGKVLSIGTRRCINNNRRQIWLALFIDPWQQGRSRKVLWASRPGVAPLPTVAILFYCFLIKAARDLWPAEYLRGPLCSINEGAFSARQGIYNLEKERTGGSILPLYSIPWPGKVSIFLLRE